MSTQAALISMAAPYLVGLVADIIADAVNPEGVVEFRDKILDHVSEFVKKTETPFDDNVAKTATENILTVDNFAKWGRQILEWAKQYVTHTKTPWDDFCIPLIDILDEILSQAADEVPV